MKRLHIGTNLFENCTNPIVIAGVSLFSLNYDSKGIKLSVNIASPPANTAITVIENIVKQGDIQIKIAETVASITFNGFKLIEINVAENFASVNIDLRPLGLHIYTDSNALYVGGAQLSANVIKNCENGILIGD